MSASPSSNQWVSGRYFDGRSSSSSAVRARVVNGALQLEVAGKTHSYAAEQVRLGVQVGSANSYLHLSDGAVLESLDVTGLQRLSRALKHSGGDSWLQRFEVNFKLIMCSLVAVLAFSVLGVLYGVPWLSNQIAYALPVELEMSIGEEALETMDHLWMQPSELTEARQQELLTAMSPYLRAMQSDYPAHSLQLHFRASDALGANAFALPGGNLVFTDEMVALAKNNEELAAVMAHEVGHVVHRHSMRNLVQSSLLVFVMVSLTGDVSAASDVATGLPALLANLSYQRNMETEADDFALAFLRKESIAPQRFADIMLRLDPAALEEEGGAKGERDTAGKLSSFLSTHPPTPQRIERFQTQD